ncbi:MAG: VOC family protein [Gammaproteobacteria bacterium]|nr:VOC family protein [Gammaproteobacteria bacterium]
MIGYVTLGTNDLERAAKFYDALLDVMSAKRMMEESSFVAWATSEGAPSIAVTKPFDEQSATVGNGVMVALAAESPEQVDRIHAKALELGATDEGAPGPRGEGGFYAGYFRDLDGNKLNAFCMVPGEETG